MDNNYPQGQERHSVSGTRRPSNPPPNLAQWNANAAYWDATLQQEGNNMFRELILPAIEDLADLKPGDRVLDLATGNGIVARRLADAVEDVRVLGTDYSPAQLENARRRTDEWWERRWWQGQLDGKKKKTEEKQEEKEREEMRVTFEELDLLDGAALDEFAERHRGEFGVITASMLLKELCDIEPLAEFLPKVLKRGSGKVIMANLHPCFHKPAAHRVIEVFENPQTGEQETHHSIKVSRYLAIEPVQSQALRGQPEPLIWFHRPIHELVGPFFRNGLMMDRLREPGFSRAPSGQILVGPAPNSRYGGTMDSGASGNNTQQQQNPIHSYENFSQIPMQFIFRLVYPSSLSA